MSTERAWESVQDRLRMDCCVCWVENEQDLNDNRHFKQLEVIF